MLRLRSDIQGSEIKETNEVIIQNIDYRVSESELKEFLTEWKPNIVFIPYQTMTGIRYYHPRPYGIAYVKFDTVEDATRLINDLQLTYYKGRCIRLNYHVPYERLKRRSGQAPQEYIAEQLPDDNDISKDTIYCRSLPTTCTGSDLRSFVELFNPIEFWIYKAPANSLFSGCCLPHSRRDGYIYSALVKLETVENIEDICCSLNKQKLCGKKVRFIPALNSIIQEVQRATENSSDNPPTQQIEPTIDETTRVTVRDHNVVDLQELDNEGDEVRSH